MTNRIDRRVVEFALKSLPSAMYVRVVRRNEVRWLYSSRKKVSKALRNNTIKEAVPNLKRCNSRSLDARAR